MINSDKRIDPIYFRVKSKTFQSEIIAKSRQSISNAVDIKDQKCVLFVCLLVRIDFSNPHKHREGNFYFRLISPGFF